MASTSRSKVSSCTHPHGPTLCFECFRAGMERTRARREAYAQRALPFESPKRTKNALTAQAAQNVVVVMTGPATNLARLLSLPGVKDLIADKVKLLVLAGGPEAALQADLPAARRLLAEWPAPIVVIGDQDVRFPATSVDKDFDWSPAHPVADAYRAFQAMPYDAPTGALAAVLYAVRPDKATFSYRPRGH